MNADEKQDLPAHRYRLPEGTRIDIRTRHWGDAASPLEMRVDDGEWFGTAHQVADARHSPWFALRLLLESASGLDMPEDDAAAAYEGAVDLDEEAE